jgi:hypothetical protein
MSQHIFRGRTSSGQLVEILCGWDRPLQYHHLTIETVCLNPDEDRVIYTNLQERDPALNVDDIEAKCIELGIAIPAGLLAALDQDEVENVGNGRRDWDEQPAAA